MLRNVSKMGKPAVVWGSPCSLGHDRVPLNSFKIGRLGDILCFSCQTLNYDRLSMFLSNTGMCLSHCTTLSASLNVSKVVNLNFAI